jgi:hypothetical protein
MRHLSVASGDHLPPGVSSFKNKTSMVFLFSDALQAPFACAPGKRRPIIFLRPRWRALSANKADACKYRNCIGAMAVRL